MEGLSRRAFLTLTGVSGAAITLGSPLLARTADAIATPDAQMKAVLDELATFEAPPIEKQSPFNARNNPTIANAVMGLLAKQG